MKKIYSIILVVFLFVSLISCGNDDVDIIKCTNCGEENETTAKYCKSCGESISDENNNEEENEGGENNNETNTAEVAFDVSKFANISSQQLVEILGQPDNITQTCERGFASFPCSLYDYENHELGFLRFDIINDKVTAISINGELPYNNGNVLETLNVKITNDDYFSEGDMYKKWECPTDTIDLIHITIIDNEKNTYKSLSVEFDSHYYREWNLPIFYGNITPGEYSVQTQEFIKSLLDSPKSADFPMLDWNYARNDYYFGVESYVDAKNGFGVEIRHNFSVVYFNDTSIMAYAIFDGIVVANNGYIPTEDIIKDLFDNNNDNPTPSNPSTDNKINVDDCVLYIEEDLPITINSVDGDVIINNIEYVFFVDDRSENACIIGISFDLLSDEYIEGFSLEFSLIGETTGNIQEYVIDDINVYGSDGNYISITTDCCEGTLPIDNYTIVFENIVENEDNSNLSIDDLYLYVQDVELENSSGSVMFSEIGGLFVEAENGMCNLSITFFGDKYQENYFYLEYLLVGEHTGTVLEFSDYIYEYSDYHDGYYNFVFTTNHNNIPIDYYTIVFEDITTEDSSENLSIEDLYLTVQEFEFDNFENTDYVIIGEIEWEFYSLSNGKCGLEITIYGDYLVYLEYSLVGKYTGTIIEFSDYLSFHSNENTNYNYDYFFISEIEHENIPMDCYTLIIDTVIVY